MRYAYHQQKLAGMILLEELQLVQMRLASRQLSTKKGMQQQTPVKQRSKKHQIHVVPPGCLCIKEGVALPQVGQGKLTLF